MLEYKHTAESFVHMTDMIHAFNFPCIFCVYTHKLKAETTLKNSWIPRNVGINVHWSTEVGSFIQVLGFRAFRSEMKTLMHENWLFSLLQLVVKSLFHSVFLNFKVCSEFFNSFSLWHSYCIISISITYQIKLEFLRFKIVHDLFSLNWITHHIFNITKSIEVRWTTAWFVELLKHSLNILLGFLSFRWSFLCGFFQLVSSGTPAWCL